MSAVPDSARVDDSLRVTNPTRVPARRYYDETFFRQEADHLWSRAWQMACRVEEIPQAGDWVEYEILGKSVIVIRTGDGIKAFHNACRHRGVKLASGFGNCSAQGFVCPFHAWRWDMDGESTFVFGRSKFSEADLDQADLALVPCRVELWGGCAFINFDEDALPLLDCLGDAAKRMDARRVGDLKVEWWRAASLPVNWKLAMEAFMEGYHVMATHPQLYTVSTPESRMYGPASPTDTDRRVSSESAQAYVDVTIAHLAKLSEGMAGMVHGREVAIAESLRDMELPENIGAAAGAFYTRLREEITRQGRAEGRPVHDLVKVAAEQPFHAVEYLFPNYFLLPMFSGMSSYRVRPTGPETCLFEIWSMVPFPESEKRDPPVAPVPWRHDDPNFPEIPRQDYSNLPLQQLGLHAHGFEFMRLSPEVEGLISNYHRLIDGFIDGRDRAQLAKGACATGLGLDAPIVDIGF